MWGVQNKTRVRSLPGAMVAVLGVVRKEKSKASLREGGNCRETKSFIYPIVTFLRCRASLNRNAKGKIQEVGI